MNDVLNEIGGYGIVPIVAINKVEEARSLAKALLAANLPVLEITFRTALAEDGIKLLTNEFPEFLAGAGTVLTTKQAQKAIDAGAKFILSPGFNPGVVDYCLERKVAVFPGINAPTQIELALEKGLRALKYFPAETSGGLPHLKSMSAPFSDLKFMATGGVGMSNLAEYLSFNKILACGGSWIARSGTIAAGDWEEVTRVAKESVQTVLGFEPESVAVTDNLPEGIADLFSGKLRGAENSGCITIKTNSLSRALFYLGKRGITGFPDGDKTAALDYKASGSKIKLKEV